MQLKVEIVLLSVAVKALAVYSRPGGHFEFQWIQMQAVSVGEGKTAHPAQ